jgi:hypothetical protein
MIRMVPIRVFPAQTLDGAAAIESSPIDLRYIDHIVGFQMRVASAGGTADAKVEYAIGVGDDPSTVVFGEYADTDDIEDATSGLTTPEGWNSFVFPTVVAPFMRLRVTGVGANPADTVLEGVLLVKEF